MNKELKIGIVFVIVFITLIVGINYLKGINVLNKNRTFFAVYNDIAGLQVGSPIMVNGYQVGMVGNIDLLSSQELLVTLKIDHDLAISNNSNSRIINRDLMGTKAISLILGNSTYLMNEGDTFITSVEGTLQDEVNAQILPLKNKAEELISSMDSVMIIITAVLDKDARKNLSNSFKSLEETFDLMSKSMSKVDMIIDHNNEKVSKIISNLESISLNISSHNDQIKNIINNISSISDTLLRKDILSIIDNFNQISSNINNGEGSLGLLIKDDTVYKNLENSTAQLSELIEDMKKHPSRYVNFSILGGKKPYKKEK
ncbi:MAG: hypothetical protein CMP73_01865 [Flavobacteriales bacterium]|nr:hypothetical protein [Flavobacteriales bacterium]